MPDNIHHSNHAEKNLKFLKIFYNTYNHNDWSITVSFYTALHVIESAIYSTGEFEIQGKKLKFKGTEEGKIVLINNNIIKTTDKTSPHHVRGIIVQNSFQDIDAHYSALCNMAWSARYIQFAWEQKEAYFAVEFYLKEILKWHNNKFGSNFDADFKKSS